MAKPNYQFEKRQRDLAKKAKKEEKKQRKVGVGEGEPGAEQEPGTDTPALPAGEPGTSPNK